MSEAQQVITPQTIYDIPGVPFIEGTEGLIDLGPSNPSAIKRLARYVQLITNAKMELPISPFIKRYAERVTNLKDKQDVIFFLSGRRGSGKSYSHLYIGKRLGEAIAEIVGGTWEDYFNLDNCALLEDTDRIMHVLRRAKKHQVILIDDVGVGASAKNWNSRQNKNLGKLVTVCRTNRWILLLCAPLKKQADNTIREFVDLHGRVFQSYHDVEPVGFNILKIHKLEISEETNTDYRYRLIFSDKKVDFYVTLAPDKKMSDDYDIQREEAVVRLNISLAPDPEDSSAGGIMKSRAERNLEVFLAENAPGKQHTMGEDIAIYAKLNPGATVNKLAAHYMKSNLIMERAVEKLGIQVKKPKSKRRR